MEAQEKAGIKGNTDPKQNPKDEAVKTLIEAIKIANKRGAFELKESAIIFNSVQILEGDA
jgi:hypothetical protein